MSESLPVVQRFALSLVPVDYGSYCVQTAISGSRALYVSSSSALFV